MHRADAQGFVLPCLLAIGQFLVFQSASGYDDDDPISRMNSSSARVEFDRPADLSSYRLNGMPLGNGSLGAMVNGDPHTEVVLLNHEQIRPIWYREKETRVSDQLPLVRKLALEERWPEAQAAFDGMAYGAGGQRKLNVYHPAANLIIESEALGAVRAYRRHLDLETGIGEVRFQAGGVSYRRSYFVSAPHNRFVLRSEGDQPGSISCRISLTRPPTEDCEVRIWTESEPTGIAMRADYGLGLQFEIKVQVINEGGSVTDERSSNDGPGLETNDLQETLASLSISQADSLTIQVEIAVNGSLPRSGGRDSGGHDSQPIPFDQLLSAHLRDYREHFKPVHLTLAEDGPLNNCMVTADRLVLDSRRQEKMPSPRLYELIFHMGRHLLFSSSRRGTLAPNLQGIWSGSYDPAWQARYQFDLNVQYNHWPADATGLRECNLPLFDLLEGLIPQGRRFARDMYGVRGIFFPVASDGLNIRYPTMLETPAIAGWLARHFWEHYLYTLDEEFLRDRAYPFMKEVEAFFDDYLFRGTDGLITILPSGVEEVA
jgi:alpha-L-fucosidase 2